MMGLMNLKPQLSLADCGPMLTHHPGSSDHQQDHAQDVGHEQGDGPKGDKGPKQEQSHAMFNQNMTVDEDSEEELIDDLLKDV